MTRAPQHKSNRLPDNEWTDEEELFRRFSKTELIGGAKRLNPDKIEIGAPSYNRARYSLPLDVLHRDCCAGNDRSGQGIYAIRVSVIWRVDGDLTLGRFYVTLPVHKPEETCYAHTEVWSLEDGFGTPKKPVATVRRFIRNLIASKAEILKEPD